MCVENDGRNYAQLKWARVDDLVDRFIRTRLWESRELYNGWPAESNINALAIYIMFMMLDEGNVPTYPPCCPYFPCPFDHPPPERISAYTQQQRVELLLLIRPYLLTATRYPNAHAPDNHFTFPISRILLEENEWTFPTPHGFWPLYRQPRLSKVSLRHFGVQIILSAPLIALGAKLLHIAFFDALPVPPVPLARDRASAIAAGQTFIGPTLADYEEANARRSAQLAKKGSWHWRDDPNEVKDEEQGKMEDASVYMRGLKAASAQWDLDWIRWTECINPWAELRVRPVTYFPGSLTGEWQGRIFVSLFPIWLWDAHICVAFSFIVCS